MLTIGFASKRLEVLERNCCFGPTRRDEANTAPRFLSLSRELSRPSFSRFWSARFVQSEPSEVLGEFIELVRQMRIGVNIETAAGTPEIWGHPRSESRRVENRSNELVKLVYQWTQPPLVQPRAFCFQLSEGFVNQH